MTTALPTCQFSGAGSNADEGASVDQVEAVSVAKDCLLAALKVDPKASHTWANLANAYHLCGDHKSSSKCLEKVLLAQCYSHFIALFFVEVSCFPSSFNGENLFLSFYSNELLESFFYIRSF